MDGTPFVTVLVPTLNEERDISECIVAIGDQTYGASNIELLVIDGQSSDATVINARQSASGFGFPRFFVLANPVQRTTTALNIGLATAVGDFIIRVDARSRVQANYVERCVALLSNDTQIGVVGGAQVGLPRGPDALASGIARGLRNRLSTGLGRYRWSTRSGATDTVWMGAFRAEDLRRLGGWDSSVGLNEDYELNARFRSQGFLVWYAADLRSGYLPRDTLRALARQYWAYGKAKGRSWAGGSRMEVRHIALLVAPIFAAASWVFVGRQMGWLAAAVAIPTGLVAIDQVGSSGPAPFRVRCLAAATIAVYAASWFAGVVFGIPAGRLVRRRRRPGHDQHREAQAPEVPAPSERSGEPGREKVETCSFKDGEATCP